MTSGAPQHLPASVRATRLRWPHRQLLPRSGSPLTKSNFHQEHYLIKTSIIRTENASQHAFNSTCSELGGGDLHIEPLGSGTLTKQAAYGPERSEHISGGTKITAVKNNLQRFPTQSTGQSLVTCVNSVFFHLLASNFLLLRTPSYYSQSSEVRSCLLATSCSSFQPQQRGHRGFLQGRKTRANPLQSFSKSRMRLHDKT